MSVTERKEPPHIQYATRIKFEVKQDDGQAMAGKGVLFERTRRITGYLVGSLERFNNAKRAEERARVKHHA